jgi:hypothetical protein
VDSIIKKPNGQSTAEPQSRFPAFPKEALKGSLGELARVLADGTEVPQEYIFASALTFAGSMLSGFVTLDIGIEVDTRLFTVLLGDSGEPKKSTALRKVRSFFDSLGSTKMPRIEQGVGSAEGLARVLNENCDVLLAYDELRALLDKAKAQSSVLLPLVAGLHESHEWDNTTKTKPLQIRNARLSLIGCCTSDTYEAMWDRQAIAIGLPNRLFVVTGSREKKICWPKAADVGKVVELKRRIGGQLAQYGAERGMMTLSITDDAKERFQTWYAALDSSPHATRLDTIGRTLMVLYAVTMDKMRVDLEVVDVVLLVLDYELQVRVATDPIDAENTIARVEEKVRRFLKSHPGSTRRDIHRGINADRVGTWALAKALENLAGSGEVQAVSQRHTLRNVG